MMQPMAQAPAITELRFSEAVATFSSGAFQSALAVFEPFEAADDWFVKAYPYLHELRLHLMTELPPDERAKVKEADSAALLRFNRLQNDPPIPVIPDGGVVRGGRYDPGFDPHSGELEVDFDTDSVPRPGGIPDGGASRWRGAWYHHFDQGGGQDGGGIGGRSPRTERRDDGPTAVEEASPTAPQPVITVKRTPHVGVDKDLPLQPGTEFNIDVYLDSSAPLAGETSRAVEAAAGWREDLRIALPPIEAIVEPMESWTDGIAFIGVNFFVDARSVGQVTRTIEVAGHTIPESPPANDTLVVPMNGAPVADLTVTITADPSRDGRSFWCFVSTPHLEKYRAPITGPWNLQSTTQQLVNGFMGRFTAAGTPRVQLIAELKGVGAILFDSSPEIFREVFWALIDAKAPLRTIAIVSAEPFIPWELMIPNRAVPTFSRRLPLGVEFEIGRWTDEKTVAPAWSLRLTDSSIIAPAYTGTMILKNSLNEANMVVEQYPGDIIRPASFESVGKELGTVSRSLIHFICHGKDTATGIQCIRLDNNEELSSSNILGIDGLGELFAQTRPVIFLNACEIGRIIPSLVGLGGFVASFIKLGATAVIAPLWSVEDTIAHEIATLFYQEIKQNPGQTVAQIFRKVRAKGYDPASGRDTYVAYCFYGDPSARVAIAGM
ncbi:hypothetical protein ACVI1L_005026 [Bradyrhizobium sp. USDA 4516]